MPEFNAVSTEELAQVGGGDWFSTFGLPFSTLVLGPVGVSVVAATALGAKALIEYGK